MTNLRQNSNRAKAVAHAAQNDWLLQVAVLASAVFILLATVVMAPLADAAEDGAGAPASEASGHDLYRRGYYEEAIAEWKKAVEENGDAGAAFRLGEEYFDAKIVQRDIGQAVKYFKLGAEGGDPRAQHDLATLYDNGWGVDADVNEAARWYLAAAQQGSAVAQYNIATMYQTGAGVEQDIAKAYMYFLLAVEGGFPHFATTELDKISREMTAQQIKDATLMARQFKPAGQGAAGNGG